MGPKSPPFFEGARRKVILMPEVLESHRVSGSSDQWVKTRILALNKIPVAAQLNSYVVMEEIKESTALALDR